MRISLAERVIELTGHDFAEFNLGPVAGRTARFDPERAQVGQLWHGELRDRMAATRPDAQFEVAFDHSLLWRGWRFCLKGRIDQLLPGDGGAIVREIKTVLRPLPSPAEELIASYSDYFCQLAAYQCVRANEDGDAAPGALVFVEPASGFVQEVPQTPAEARVRFDARLDEIWNFAERRRAGLERLRELRFAPAFSEPRAGQETIVADLSAAALLSPVVLFEAPTGYGKTGCVLEYGLGELAAGRLSRLIYLTGKSTGQLQVLKQLDSMLGDPPGATRWQIRNKGEHCINEVYHCFRDACSFLDGQKERWPASGLQRFGQDASTPRDIATLRQAGREAHICPYEITRAGLPFSDVWIADFNYIFAPSNRSFLENLPGFEAAHTLLVIDEAHNLPSRVADNYSDELSHAEARTTLAALHGTGAPAALLMAWERLTLLLGRVGPADTLDPLVEADLLDALIAIGQHTQSATLDYSALGPTACDALFRTVNLSETVSASKSSMPELIWVPEPGVIRFTCLDASAAIAATLGAFGHVVFLSATLSPVDVFVRQCGLDTLGLTPRHLTAPTPWRDDAYDVAVDVRVDTRYQQRARHFVETAATIAAMYEALSGPVAVFFPSYNYAENIYRLLEESHPVIRSRLQQRGKNLVDQQSFIEEALVFSDVLLLVLGSGFAEGIDLLGGRLSGAMVVGPALPEVNAVRRAALAASRAPSREDAFREVYQIPGMQKVNQALGRLVRAPGQRARVLLHCRRFAGLSYQRLLAPEYQNFTAIATAADLHDWLHAPAGGG